MIRCTETKDGQQCVLEAGHSEPHSSTSTSVTTRRYDGSLHDATAAFQRDAANMARSDWYPTSQAYAPGSWGCGAFLVALLLCFLVIGFLVFIYMLIVKPDGSLVVTYEYRPPVTPVTQGQADPAAELARLAQLRDRGLITPEEYAAKRVDIMARL